MHPVEKTYFQSPLGMLEIVSSDHAVFSVTFVDNTAGQREKIAASAKECVQQLDEYFKDKRKVFELKLQPSGTPFQLHVWDALLQIPFGKTLSYLQMARNLGDEKSIRAAASANGRNPIAIIIPCHRVIGANGDLVGYAGGLKRKEWLLAFEKGEQQMNLF